MAIVRFELDGIPRYGIIEGESIVPIVGDPCDGEWHTEGPALNVANVRLLAPCSPSKVILVSSNYRSVLNELGKEAPAEPLIFLKPPTAIIGPWEAIRIPAASTYITYEPELALVVGRECRNVSTEAAPEYIMGHTCINDVSARDIQNREVQFTRAKGYDTFCPTGPVIELGFPDTSKSVCAYLNGSLVVESTTEDMVFSAQQLVSFISTCMTLLPGDVISTGAGGFGAMEDGDVIDIEIDGVGRLSNQVEQL